MSLIVDEHREYLSDEARVAAFRAAIREVVAPGAVVADLASGTGILGLLACEAGASRVYSIEVGGMIEIARAVAAANGYGDRVIPIHGLSAHVALPERVDAVVCDQIGRFGFEAGLLEHGLDARDRFLKTGGTMVPSRLDLFVAPVDLPELYGQVQFWQQRPAGFDFSPARRWAVNTGYPVLLEPAHLLGAPGLAASLDLTTCRVEPFELSARLPIERPGVLHGIGGWFAARLSPSATLTNAPGAARRIHRRNAFLPIDAEVRVAPGDAVLVRVRVMPGAATASWFVEVERSGAIVSRFRHSTLGGALVAREELRATNPGFLPALTPRGRARASVLELCDGRRPLAEIERAMFERHRDLFATLTDAQIFVSEVVTRYTH